MATQGPLYPSTNSASGWNRATYLPTDDGTYAGLSVIEGPFPRIMSSNPVICTNYGFSIPTGATINGILVQIKRYKYALYGGVGASCNDYEFRLRKADATNGTDNKADATAWNDAPGAYYSYGGSTDLWGDTWAPADINDADFGVYFVPKVLSIPLSDGISIRIDTIRITVYYTEGGSSSAIKSVNGLAKASVKSVNGLAIASVKNINGLA